VPPFLLVLIALVCVVFTKLMHIYMEKGLGAMTISRVRDAFYVGIMQANLSYREAPIGNIHLVFFVARFLTVCAIVQILVIN
jgi:hypothetical protein